MDIINYSIDWVRGEVFAARVIALISVFVLLCAAGFYLWGKTSMARAYWLPLAVSGVFLVVVAGGLYYANHPRIEKFQEQYRENTELFVQGELERTAKSDRDLTLIVFRVLPILVMLCALGAMFITKTQGRAWFIVLMMLFAFLMAVDSNTRARNAEYHDILLKVNSHRLQ
ncbi:MAG: hypothetical protein IJ197_02125 [Bacteroidaceae bacterium]|nr:hypothetical protein [Bacteroidaceae bacterium]